MMGSTRRLSVFAYAQPCDMRKSFDSLASLVQQALGKDRKRAKALHWDGTGLCLYSNQLSSHCTSFVARAESVAMNEVDNSQGSEASVTSSASARDSVGCAANDPP
jgi:hypothetical protein